MAYILASYGEKQDQTQSETDLAKILMELGEGEAEIEQEEKAAPEPEIDESDSVIVKLANQLILEAYARGASDIHIEPDGPKNPCLVRLRIDGDCEKYLEIPARIAMR